MNLGYTKEQEQLVESFGRFFEFECPTSRVRTSEPLGFDAALWREFAELGGIGISVPEGAGGGGGKLLDHAIVAGLWGAALAPVPLPEVAASARLLARMGTAETAAWLTRCLNGEAVVTLPVSERFGRRQLIVPAGAVADAVVVPSDGAAAVVPCEGSVEERFIDNLGSSPLGRVDLGATGCQVVERGSWMDLAVCDWKVMMANGLAGIAGRALDIAVAYTSERVQFGVPIATFQTISHRLADLKTEVDGARLLALEAAWAGDERPTSYPRLATMAFTYAAEVARHAAAESLHFHGGYGFMKEHDIQLYFRRAKAWPLVAGEPRRGYQAVADEILSDRSWVTAVL